jgi:3-oxoacyl-[acyl-carrier protein] reductase
VRTRQWAVAYGGRGITVNALAPGAIDTDMNAEWLRGNPEAKTAIEAAQALKRIGKAEDIGDAVAFLAGPDSRWVTGQYIEASGGWLI